MKQKEFSVLLDEMLKQLPYSKNDVIVRTGINRSTFYQFLNGKRFPTAKHMAAILGKAGFSEEDKKILEDAWGKAGTQYETYSALQSMLSCMDAICASESLRVGRPGRVVNTAAPGSGTSEDMLSRKGTAMLPGDEAGSEIQAASPHLTAASGSISVLSMIIGFIRRAAMPGSRGHISAFLPQRVLRVLEKSLQEFDSTFRGRLICQFPDEAGKGTRFAAEAFREVLPLVMDTECSVYAYYDSSDLARQTGLLYPYYVIGGGRVLFVSAAADRALECADPSIAQDWENAFSRMLPYTQEITLRGSTLRDVHEGVLKALTSEDLRVRPDEAEKTCPDAEKDEYGQEEQQQKQQKQQEEQHESQRLYILAHAPCMSTMATEELIRWFVQKEARQGMLAYCRTVQNTGTVEVVSAEGLRTLAETGEMEEWGIRAAVSKEELHAVFSGLKMRLGKTLFIADNSRIAIPEQWVLYIIPGYSMTLIPQRRGSAIVSVSEPNVQGAFFSSVHNSLDYFVLKQDNARRVLEECFRIIAG